MDLPWSIAMPILFAAGLLAGLIDSIAGGGGLIGLPTLMAMGVPPHVALGTNKLQGTFGTLTASTNFFRNKLIDTRQAIVGVTCTLIGAAGGALTAQWLEARWIGRAAPFLLVGVLIFLLRRPRLTDIPARQRMKPHVFYLVAGLVLGFYDGVFGPGTGAFWVVAIMWATGLGMRQATGYTKLMNFTSNIVALALFILGGNVWFVPGLIMAGGQIVGASVGSTLAIRRGAVVIRPVLVMVVAITAAKLVYDYYLGG